ncbi:DUF2163 domain-containing protein [Aurantiacibacter gangjinensis]|uniref:Bacteriophage phiJL001 Gp84 C-terminal domain-containing protein n=1 Tax=Aurantiacibacter gangjinensis TaxID=502682 RepID=A0A0G9MLS5_9SPHN|nr:DUF2163 domain-containing protein [Aurantiacibacter gangjinensis]APE27651.1 Gene Transfer Agent FAD/FMN-containing dehydrogenase [Aurantiacibacter gangjinensis]KLE31671.1 hypothetical protein AAW01_09110 [Aurantiacibacter gangjinensis]
MSHTFFARELEGVATFWRIIRKDGAMLAFTSHDRALVFDDITHLSAPGMLPSAIRRTAQLERDTVEVDGVLSHDSITEDDLLQGRYADARISIGLVDWETLDRATLFTGTLGNISAQDNAFSAELRSAKAALEEDFVPRTSPTCRASFCDADCRLNPAMFTAIATVVSVDPERNSVLFDGITASDCLHGDLWWIDGQHAGRRTRIIDLDGSSLVLEMPISGDIQPGTRAYVREGCDHTVATCAARFGNAVNFQGEPFLPGNDLLTRYPTSSS